MSILARLGITEYLMLFLLVYLCVTGVYRLTEARAVETDRGRGFAAARFGKFRLGILVLRLLGCFSRAVTSGPVCTGNIAIVLYYRSS